MARHAQGKRLIVQPRAVESGPVPALLGSPGPTELRGHGGSMLGTGEALRDACGKGFLTIHPSGCPTGSREQVDHSFTDGLDSS